MGLFADILEKENLIVGVDFVFGAHHLSDQGKAASHQGTFAFAFLQDHPIGRILRGESVSIIRVFNSTDRIFIEKSPLEIIESVFTVEKGSGSGTVECDQSCFLIDWNQQSGDIAEAD